MIQGGLGHYSFAGSGSVLAAMGGYKSHLESNSFRIQFTTHFRLPLRVAEDSAAVAELVGAPLPVQVHGVDASGACSARAVAHALVDTDDIDTADNTAEHQGHREAPEEDIPALRRDVVASVRDAFPVVALQGRLLEVQQILVAVVDVVGVVVIVVVMELHMLDEEAAGERMGMVCSRY